MTTHDWRLKRRIERQYAVAIDRLLRGLQPALIGAARNPFLLAETIRNYARSPTFKAAAYKIAQAMATHIFSDGHRTWRETARAGSQGRMIYLALKKELETTQVGTTYYNVVYRNAELIGSMPESIAQRVTKKVAEGYAAGVRSTSMIDDILQMYPQLTRKHARLIARTETSKASTALTRARCQLSDVGWYVWRTCDDERVRKSHDHMDGVLISWNDPPSPEELIHKKSVGNYHAGDIFNCRCYPEPLLEYDDVSWPAKVYWQGKIQYLTLARFRAITGGDL